MSIVSGIPDPVIVDPEDAVVIPTFFVFVVFFFSLGCHSRIERVRVRPSLADQGDCSMAKIYTCLMFQRVAAGCTMPMGEYVFCSRRGRKRSLRRLSLGSSASSQTMISAVSSASAYPSTVRLAPSCPGISCVSSRSPPGLTFRVTAARKSGLPLGAITKRWLPMRVSRCSRSIMHPPHGRLVRELPELLLQPQCEVRRLSV
ncbi:hypothetical protein [Meiothermus phage MMP17]|nr:hypothetical protein [Meiothermus phage MMP17]